MGTKRKTEEHLYTGDPLQMYAHGYRNAMSDILYESPQIILRLANNWVNKQPERRCGIIILTDTLSQTGTGPQVHLNLDIQNTIIGDGAVLPATIALSMLRSPEYAVAIQDAIKLFNEMKTNK